MKVPEFGAEVTSAQDKLLEIVADRISYARRGFHRMERNARPKQQVAVTVLMEKAYEQGARDVLARFTPELIGDVISEARYHDTAIDDEALGRAVMAVLRDRAEEGRVK